MGLDVTHIKLTHKMVEEGDYLLAETWEEDCNVPLQVYEKYLTKVKTYDFDTNIAVVENEEMLNKLKDSGHFKESNFIKIFVGERSETMKKACDAFIRKEKLDTLEKNVIRGWFSGSSVL